MGSWRDEYETVWYVYCDYASHGVYTRREDAEAVATAIRAGGSTAQIVESERRRRKPLPNVVVTTEKK